MPLSAIFPFNAFTLINSSPPSRNFISYLEYIPYFVTCQVIFLLTKNIFVIL
nr:MAG TPA: hypothetical protein [Caudoviricetes sp.]